MRPVLRRIAIHGGITAVLLALIGFLFAELASNWMYSPPSRGGVKLTGPEPAELRVRVPLLMAAWGFGFVAVGELVVYGLRRKRTPPPLPRQTDDTDKLLQELLAKAEGKASGNKEAADEVTKDKGQR